MIRSRPTIGFFVSKLDYEYQRMIYKGLHDTAKEQNANLICFPGEGINSRDGYQYMANIIYSIAGAECLDGIVILTNTIGHILSQEELIRFCKSYSPLPFLSIGLNLPGIESIITDNNSGMEELIRHLISQHNCRKIALITGPEGHQEAEQRYKTFYNVCTASGLMPDDDYVVRGTFHKHSGEQAVLRLLGANRAKPDAIIASNDSMALGAIEALVDLGLRVPEDIIVVGFDDILESEYFTPPLTTVHQPVTEIGTVAINTILGMIGGNTDTSCIVLPTHCVIRQSCGCLPVSVKHKAALQIPGQISGFSQHRAEWEKTIIDSWADTKNPENRSRGIVFPFGQKLEECLDSFHDDMVNERRDGFLPLLNSILRESVLSGSDVSIWYDVIEAMRHATLGYSLSRKEITKAEDIWGKARSLVAETTVRLHEHRRMSTEHWTNRLKEIGNMLITTFDIKRLVSVIEQALKELNVRLLFCNLYSRNEPLPRKSKLLFAFDGNGMIESERLAEEFPSSLLVPPVYDLFITQRTVIMEALYFQDEQLGYLLCEANPDEPLIYDTLRQQISSALKGAFLVEEIKNHAVTLENEVAKRTRELVTVNEKLEDEIGLRKKVEENLLKSEKNLRSITEAIPLPLVIVRPTDGLIHYANTPFIEAFGATGPIDEIRTIYDFFLYSDLNPIIEKLLFFPELSHMELAARKCDGSLFWVISSFRKMVFRQEEAIIAGFYDLTERRELEREIIEVSGNERMKIGQELHDDICQNMVGISAIGKVLENQLSLIDPEKAEKAAYLNQLINTTLVKTKALSEGLYPAGLEKSGLLIMLNQLAKNTELQFNVRCSVIEEETGGCDDDLIALHLYRIAQEAINNAVKHANPDTIEIHFSPGKEKMELRISDNGTGIRDDFERSMGLGIKSMRYRSNIIGGIFEIKKNDVSGTSVRCSVRKRGEYNEKSDK
jgi:DNA-binding LacI/PurR family transcriptional regulator/signal transduction histidine kinase